MLFFNLQSKTITCLFYFHKLKSELSIDFETYFAVLFNKNIQIAQMNQKFKLGF